MPATLLQLPVRGHILQHSGASGVRLLCVETSRYQLPGDMLEGWSVAMRRTSCPGNTDASLDISNSSSQLLPRAEKALAGAHLEGYAAGRNDDN